MVEYVYTAFGVLTVSFPGITEAMTDAIRDGSVNYSLFGSMPIAVEGGEWCVTKQYNGEIYRWDVS